MAGLKFDAAQTEAHLKANMAACPTAVQLGITPQQWAQLIAEIIALLAGLNPPAPTPTPTQTPVV